MAGPSAHVPCVLHSTGPRDLRLNIRLKHQNWQKLSNIAAYWVMLCWLLCYMRPLLPSKRFSSLLGMSGQQPSGSVDSVWLVASLWSCPFEFARQSRSPAVHRPYNCKLLSIQRYILLKHPMQPSGRPISTRSLCSTQYGALWNPVIAIKCPTQASKLAEIEQY